DKKPPLPDQRGADLGRVVQFLVEVAVPLQLPLVLFELLNKVVRRSFQRRRTVILARLGPPQNLTLRCPIIPKSRACSFARRFTQNATGSAHGAATPCSSGCPSLAPCI